MPDAEIIDAAMCLWEATLNQRGEPKVDAAFEAHGSVAVRYYVGGLAERCEADYQKARKRGYDDCFDWEGPMAIAGRLWVDAETHDVLRLERRLGGPTDVRVPTRLQRKYLFPQWLTIDRDRALDAADAADARLAAARGPHSTTPRSGPPLRSG